MKIAIYGHGYVGSAVAHSFNDTSHTLLINDPKFNSEPNHDADCAIICVDTPKTKLNPCDISQVEAVLSCLSDKKDFNVLIKSSIVPNLLRQIQRDYPHLNIAYSPEYLASRNNIQDFMDQDFMIIGSDKIKVSAFFEEIFKEIFPKNKVHKTDLVTASLVKYAENSFLAHKVTFFNAMFDIHACSDTETTFGEFVRLLTLDSRIGTSHTDVPGWDGQKGWGGHCLEKDVPAFVDYAKSIGVNDTIMEDVIRQNLYDRQSK